MRIPLSTGQTGEQFIAANNNNFSVLFPKWEGKKMCTYGDSITHVNMYQPYVISRLGIDTHYLRGVGGTRIVNNDNMTYWAYADGSFAAAPNSQNPPANSTEIDAAMCMQERVNTLPLDSDLILICASANDDGTIGTLADAAAENTTIYAGWHLMIQRITARIPDAKIVIISMPFHATADSLMGYWNFDNGAIDISGNGNDGNLSGSTLTNNTGFYNNSANFNEILSSVNVSFQPYWRSNNSNFTVMAWVWFNSSMAVNTQQDVISHGGGGSTSADWELLKANGASTIKLQIWGAGAGSHCAVTSPTNSVLNQTWVHLVAQYKFNQSCTVYVNGVPTTSATISGSPQNGAVSQGLIFGRIIDTQLFGFRGYIDEAMFWNRTLSQSEIQLLYSRGRANWTFTPYQNLTDAPNAFGNSTNTFNLTGNYTTNLLPEFEEFTQRVKVIFPFIRLILFVVLIPVVALNITAPA